MALPALSEATIRGHASDESYSRGASYFAQRAVGDLVLRGSTLSSDVEGGEVEPYRVRVTFDKAGVTMAICTCPYDWGGWCKHIVATLLKAIYEPGAIEERPPLDTLLADLDRSQLQTLLVDLANADPDTADEIERRAGLMRLATSGAAKPADRAVGAAPRRSPIDQAMIRQQVRLALRPARRGRYEYDYYDEDDPGDEFVEGVRPVLEQANRFVEGGEPHSALAVLEALTEEYLGASELFDEIEEIYGSYEGSAVEFFGELSEAWAAALLSAELDRDALDEWGEKIAAWREQAEDYGGGAAFDLALTAAEQGWDYPPLLRVLGGEITEKGAWEEESPDFADELALIRLRILERQGRQQEYLYLAEAEGQIDRYVAMLARMGRTQEAVDEGLKYLATPAEAAEVAKILREQGDLDGALRMAEHGVALQSQGYGNSQKAELAEWAAEMATGMGQGERALQLAEAAFSNVPSLSGYLRAQSLAGERWEAVKPPLLQHLRQSHAAEAKVDVFLHERLFDDAIAAVKDAYDARLIERVMDAVVALRPDWVIETATRQAEEIMDAGKAQHYGGAAG